MNGFIRCDDCQERTSDPFTLEGKKLCIKCYSVELSKYKVHEKVFETKEEKKKGIKNEISSDQDNI